MNIFISEQFRLAMLWGWLFVLCALEFAIPLVRSSRSTIFKTIPNLALMILLLITNLVLATAITYLAQWTEVNSFGVFNWIGVLDWRVQLITAVIFLDLVGAYLPHILFHKVAWLWRIHSVHHSDTMVDVTTAFRQHPIETVMRVMFSVAGMVLLGLPLWIYLIYVTVSAFNAQLEHSNIKVNSRIEKLVRMVFVTPNMHKIHHSKYQIETDSNYGNILSVWDRIFRTFTTKDRSAEIEYGLDYLTKSDFSLTELLFKLPFVS